MAAFKGYRLCKDCPTVILVGTPNGRCPDCATAFEKSRGTKAERGYDREYQKLRRWWARKLQSGAYVLCWRCQKPIVGKFHLGHDDDNRSIIRGPEHPECNLRAVTRKYRV